MKIYNLTQHRATPEQKAQGVIDLPETDRRMLVSLLTFDELPTQEEMGMRAKAIANLLFDIAPGGQTVMIGGAPFFMSTLEAVLSQTHRVLYAFSKRVVEEEMLPDGTVQKTAKFVHEGFVEPTVFVFDGE